MEWKLIGLGDVPEGFENVQIDGNNLSEHREILRTLAIKAVEDGTIKLCKKEEATKNDTEHDEDRGYYLRPEKEWKEEWEEEFFERLENDSAKKEMEIRGFTPLMFVAVDGSAETCKMLISAGADIDKMSKAELEDGDNEDSFSGCTALMWAVFSGQLENCKMLISEGADISKETPAESGNGGCTALHCAAKKDYPEICQLLVSAGADIDKESTKGMTPLMYAAKFNNLEICKLLVSAGADIHKESKMGWTPVMFAVSSNASGTGGEKWESCKFFIDAGADVNKKSKDGMDLFMIALYTESHGSNYVCSKLASWKPDMPKNAILDTNALAYVAEYGCSDLCELFILLGADVDKENKDGWTPLIKAIDKRRDTTCELLISLGANVDEGLEHNSPTTPLMYAIQMGRTGIAKMLLKAGANTEKISKEDGWTPLIQAVYERQYDTCELLISLGVNVDKEVLVYDLPTTALMLAVQRRGRGYIRIASLLLKAGANTDKISKEELEMLKESYHYREMMKQSCHYSPTTVKEDTSSTDKDKEETPIYDTCESIDEVEDLTEACNMKINKSDENAMTSLLEKCKTLISAGANLDVLPYGSKVNTPLMNAASHGYSEICEVLIAAGADINLPDSNGETALMKAAKDGLVNICKILIAAGADVKMETSGKSELKGYTALHFAVLHAQHAGDGNFNYKEIFKMLISAGVNIDSDTAEGWTPLMIAAKTENSWKICRELILGGADINKKSKDGWTPLMIAVNKDADDDKYSVCKMLIQLGADITTETMPNGRTLLSCATRYFSNRCDICDTLVLRGADVNKEDKDGWTPLMKAACEDDDIRICNILIAAGANVDKEILLDNKKTATALMLAAMRGHERICDVLVSAGANILSTTHYSG